MDKSHALEVEVKLEAPTGWELPDLAGVFPGAELRPLGALYLETTYYDTAGLRLNEHHITLRHRLETPVGTGGAVEAVPAVEGGAERSIWTVKLPSSGDGSVLARPEINWAGAEAGAVQPPDSYGSAPPADALVLLAAVTLGEPLSPIARLSATRRRTEVLISHCPAAEIDDDSVEGRALLHIGQPYEGTHETVSFRELEVELVTGSPREVLDAVVALLLAAGARPSSRTSKLATVLQSAARPGSPPDGPAPREVTALQPEKARPGKARRKPTPSVPDQARRKATAADVLGQQVLVCFETLVANDPPIRLGDADPEHVHKARVATRRLRSVLWALRHLPEPGGRPEGGDAAGGTPIRDRGSGDGGPGRAGESGAGLVLGPDAMAALSSMAALRRELRWLGSALGAARDADVRVLALEDEGAALAAEDQEAVTWVIDRARSEQAGAHEQLLLVMETERYLALLRSLDTLSRAPSGAGYEGNASEGNASEGNAAQGAVASQAELWRYLNVPVAAAMGRLGAAQWRAVRRAVRRLGEDPTDESLHRLRIQAKRLRYLAEAAAPVVRPATSRRGAEAMATAATELQDVLGELHDSVVKERWLRGVVAPPPAAATNDERAGASPEGAAGAGPGVALVAGQLVAVARSKARTSRAAWKDAWRHLDRKALRWWT